MYLSKYSPFFLSLNQNIQRTVGIRIHFLTCSVALPVRVVRVPSARILLARAVAAARFRARLRDLLINLLDLLLDELHLALFRFLIIFALLFLYLVRLAAWPFASQGRLCQLN